MFQRIKAKQYNKTNLTQAHRLPGWCVPAARHGGGGVPWHDRHLGSATSACHHTAATTSHTNRAVLLPSEEETVILKTILRIQCIMPINRCVKNNKVRKYQLRVIFKSGTANLSSSNKKSLVKKYVEGNAYKFIIALQFHHPHINTRHDTHQLG